MSFFKSSSSSSSSSSVGHFSTKIFKDIVKSSSYGGGDVEQTLKSLEELKNMKKVKVCVYYNPTQKLFKHHYIVLFTPGSDAHLNVEWVDKGLVASDEKYDQYVDNHGDFDGEDVYNAIYRASHAKRYNAVDYNCNTWTDVVCGHLGKKTDYPDM